MTVSALRCGPQLSHYLQSSLRYHRTLDLRHSMRECAWQNQGSIKQQINSHWWGKDRLRNFMSVDEEGRSRYRGKGDQLTHFKSSSSVQHVTCFYAGKANNCCEYFTLGYIKSILYNFWIFLHLEKYGEALDK